MPVSPNHVAVLYVYKPHSFWQLNRGEPSNALKKRYGTKSYDYSLRLVRKLVFGDVQSYPLLEYINDTKGDDGSPVRPSNPGRV